MGLKKVDAVPKANSIEVTVEITGGYPATSAVVSAVPIGGAGGMWGMMDPNSNAQKATFIIRPLAAGPYAVSVVCSDNVYGGKITVSDSEKRGSEKRRVE